MMRPSPPCRSSAISDGTGVQARSAKQSEPEYPSEYQRDARHKSAPPARAAEVRAGLDLGFRTGSDPRSRHR
jgi:hypothetical protein